MPLRVDQTATRATATATPPQEATAKNSRREVAPPTAAPPRTAKSTRRAVAATATPIREATAKNSRREVTADLVARAAAEAEAVKGNT